MLRTLIAGLARTQTYSQNWKLGFVRQCAGGPTGELLLKSILKDKFPTAVALDVQDISGGCGAMYEVHVETPDFAGLSTIKQHRLVTEALKSQIKEMHGVRIHTKIPANI